MTGTHECIFVSPSLSQRDLRMVYALKEKLGIDALHTIHPGIQVPPDIDSRIVVGGDGSISAVTANATPDTSVLIVDRGSQNGTAENLRAKGVIVEPEALADPQNEIPQYRLGVIGSAHFHHAASPFLLEALQVQGTEWLRGKVPRKLRAYAGALYALLRYPKALDQEFVTSVFLTGQKLGPYDVNPLQDIHGDQLTLARVKGGPGALKRLVRVMFSFIHRQVPDPQNLELIMQNQFAVPLPIGETHHQVVLDGEVRQLFPKNGVIYVKRETEGPKLAVLNVRNL